MSHDRANTGLTADSSHTVLPIVKKTVFRMGVASCCGLTPLISEMGRRRWSQLLGLGRGLSKVTDGIREVIKGDGENHVVGMLGGAISAGR